MDISDFDFADSSYHQGRLGRKGRIAKHRARLGQWLSVEVRIVALTDR